MRIPVVPTLLYYTGSPIPIIGLQDGVFCTRSRNDPNSIRRQKNWFILLIDSIHSFIHSSVLHDCYKGVLSDLPVSVTLPVVTTNKRLFSSTPKHMDLLFSWLIQLATETTTTETTTTTTWWQCVKLIHFVAYRNFWNKSRAQILKQGLSTSQNFHTFPDNFMWGSATSSYQIEGAVNDNGWGPSIWDTFCLQPGNILNHKNSTIACNHYHQINADVKLMKGLGLKAYQFSITWPRILPNGEGDIN